MTLNFFLKVCGNPPTLNKVAPNQARKHCAFSILEYIAKCFYLNLNTLETSECRNFVNELITRIDLTSLDKGSKKEKNHQN